MIAPPMAKPRAAVRRDTDCRAVTLQCSGIAERAHRKPRLLFWFDGPSLLRFADRTFDEALLFQLPPRLTRACGSGETGTMRDEAKTLAPAIVVEHAYGTWLWIEERASAFPRDARRRLGHRAAAAALDALCDTTEACFLARGMARTTHLTKASRALTVLRILLRGARDRR